MSGRWALLPDEALVLAGHDLPSSLPWLLVPRVPAGRPFHLLGMPWCPPFLYLALQPCTLVIRGEGSSWSPSADYPYPLMWRRTGSNGAYPSRVS